MIRLILTTLFTIFLRTTAKGITKEIAQALVFKDGGEQKHNQFDIHDVWELQCKHSTDTVRTALALYKDPNAKSIKISCLSEPDASPESRDNYILVRETDTSKENFVLVRQNKVHYYGKQTRYQWFERQGRTEYLSEHYNQKAETEKWKYYEGIVNKLFQYASSGVSNEIAPLEKNEIPQPLKRSYGTCNMFGQDTCLKLCHEDDKQLKCTPRDDAVKVSKKYCDNPGDNCLGQLFLTAGDEGTMSKFAQHTPLSEYVSLEFKVGENDKKVKWDEAVLRHTGDLVSTSECLVKQAKLGYLNALLMQFGKKTCRSFQLTCNTEIVKDKEETLLAISGCSRDYRLLINENQVLQHGLFAMNDFEGIRTASCARDFVSWKLQDELQSIFKISDYRSPGDDDPIGSLLYSPQDEKTQLAELTKMASHVMQRRKDCSFMSEDQDCPAIGSDDFCEMCKPMCLQQSSKIELVDEAKLCEAVTACRIGDNVTPNIPNYLVNLSEKVSAQFKPQLVVFSSPEKARTDCIEHDRGCYVKPNEVAGFTKSPPTVHKQEEPLQEQNPPDAEEEDEGAETGPRDPDEDEVNIFNLTEDL